MMSNNKILTVSYGTFSCTLEGFDDSFDTMKAIAEYFRDLASDDRYFGAEPPQPDADMLTRIAEREISRRVEAHASAGGIHLRAGCEAAALTADDDGTPAMHPDQTPQPQAHLADAADQTPSAATRPAASGVQYDVGSPAVAQAPVAEYLQASFGYGIRATLDHVPSPHIAAATEPTGATAPVARPAPAVGPSDQQAVGIAAEPVATPHAAPAPDSIADKLQRIRAVVSKSHNTSSTYSEDEHAEAILEEEEAEKALKIAEFFAQGTGTPRQDPDEIDGTAHPRSPAPYSAKLVAEPTAAPAETPAPPDMAEPAAIPVADTAPYDAGNAAEPDLAAAPPQPAADVDICGMPETAVQTAGAMAEAGLTDERYEDLDGSDDDYDFSSLFAEDEGEDEADRIATDAVATDDVAPTEQAALAASETASEPPAVRARVIKVKRSEIRAALEAGLLDDAEQADDTDDDELILRLSQPDPAVTQAGDATHADAEVLEEVPAAEEEELDRLMAQADQHMDEPEGTHRRAAFSNLRGAVEAKRADDRLGAEGEPDVQEYRTDLAAAVTPRRPVAGIAGRSDRPRDQRPAPLKLVAEQRIDVPTARTGPVRPRRVAATPSMAEDADTGSFADYAAARGAHDLPDLLEAAAAYLSFVEGHDAFTRPQLMTKVRQIDPESFSREDGLRHFGVLLRSGKIEKIKGGRFTVSDDIGFRPDGERAAG